MNGKTSCLLRIIRKQQFRLYLPSLYGVDEFLLVRFEKFYPFVHRCKQGMMTLLQPFLVCNTPLHPFHLQKRTKVVRFCKRVGFDYSIFNKLFHSGII